MNEWMITLQAYKRVSGPRRKRACQGDHQSNLDRSRKGLPPDKYLSILDALLRVVHAMLREKLDEGNTRPHVEECPGEVEELGHTPPDAQSLRRRKDIGWQDQVLVNNERYEEYESNAQCHQEPTERAMKAHIFPFRLRFTDLEIGAVRNDLIQLLRVFQAIAPHQEECSEGGDHHQSHEDQKDVSVTKVRDGRGRVIGER